MTLDLPAKDGDGTCRYCLEGLMQGGDSAIYTFLYRVLARRPRAHGRLMSPVAVGVAVGASSRFSTPSIPSRSTTSSCVCPRSRTGGMLTVVTTRPRGA